MMSKWRIAGATAALALVAVLFVLTPPRLESRSIVPELPGDLDAYLKETESAAPYPLIDDTDKRIRWQVPGERTEYAIVYLHGFSATRRELSPTIEIVADALGANLFETRLTGHGRSSGALVDVRAESWLDDGAEALAIGERLGDKVIVVGTSTGATLATAILDHPLAENVSDIVLLSPNFALRDGMSRLLTMPAGPQLADALIGPIRSFETHSELHATYWSNTYPTSALVEMMRLVDYANASAPSAIDANLLVMVSPGDTVISPEAGKAFLEQVQAPNKRYIEVLDIEDPSSHMLAGEILSPSTTERVAADIVAFIKTPGRDRSAGSAADGG
ncbi:MAG: alpha/beta fold hydrolase [Woeseiaceae bacterium]|nr:alpha/beta fold hydrolase [Woeseiaceae bacterium]